MELRPKPLCVRNNRRAKTLCRVGAMDVARPFKFIRLGDIHGPQPYDVIGSRQTTTSHTRVWLYCRYRSDRDPNRIPRSCAMSVVRVLVATNLRPTKNMCTNHRCRTTPGISCPDRGPLHDHNCNEKLGDSFPGRGGEVSLHRPKGFTSTVAPDLCSNRQPAKYWAWSTVGRCPIGAADGSATQRWKVKP
jgi:hypothetical protein